MPLTRLQNKSRALQSEPVSVKTTVTIQAPIQHKLERERAPVPLISFTPSVPLRTVKEPPRVWSLSDEPTPDPDDVTTGLAQDTAKRLNIAEDALEEAAPAIPTVVECHTLQAETELGKRIAAARAANGCSLVTWLTPRGATDEPLIDQAMDDLRVSRYCLWLGDPNRIFRNCKWVADSSTNSATLHWKLGAPNKPTGSDGPAIIGFIGMAAADGSSIKPDAGWKASRATNLSIAAFTDCPLGELRRPQSA
ncbi:hypothetical protein FRC12_000132 [Ceratobasidium sp. 428]|nr:hypothetical protein FRC12_000132 [Ceratobasidium sp. 428]